LDLTGGQFDSSAVAGVLPGKEVAVGDTWKVPANVVQALCNFEGLTEHNLTGKLDRRHGGDGDVQPDRHGRPASIRAPSPS
jgi:hypothetical protein